MSLSVCLWCHFRAAIFRRGTMVDKGPGADRCHAIISWFAMPSQLITWRRNRATNHILAELEGGRSRAEGVEEIGRKTAAGESYGKWKLFKDVLLEG